MNKNQCDYCGGFTFDDSRGNCCACGGPRKEENCFKKLEKLRRPTVITYKSATFSSTTPLETTSMYASAFNGGVVSKEYARRMFLGDFDEEEIQREIEKEY